MKYVGQRIPGLTARMLASGRGTFAADLSLPEMAAMAVLRSPYAHARLLRVDAERARALPGVVAVITGEEIRAATNPMAAAANAANYPGGQGVSLYALPTDRVRFVGDAVAAVVAEDRFTAHRALELMGVEYEELPVVTDAESALAPGAPRVEPDWSDNVMLQRTFTSGDVAQALSRADGTVRGSVKAHRYVAAPMEPRACAASYDPYGGQLTVWSATQGPHPLRVYLAETLGMPERDLRVIQPNVGGGFGQKAPIFPEEVLVAYAARATGRPVKWIEERTEHFLAGGHAREEVIEFEAGYRRDGRVTALRARILADVGAPATFVGWAMAFVSAYCVPGPYKIADCEIGLYIVVTNKCPWNGYRAFGKEAACFLLERVMDRVADATALSRAEVRLKNFIAAEEFPFTQVTGAVLDSGNYASAVHRVLELAGAERFPAEQAAARREGRRLGLGLAFELTPEGCSLPNGYVQGYDGSTVRVAPSGHVTVLTGVTSPGSGNETGIAQLVADALGAGLDQIRVVQGDTDTCPFGLGNFSSRSVMIGGAAARLAALDLRAKMFHVAARALEVTPDDLDAEDGQIYVAGAPSRRLSFRDVASLVYRHAYGREVADLEPGLESTRYYRVDNVHHEPDAQGRISPYPTWPNGACIAIVEVDPDTGLVKVLRYAMVHDAGFLVNPTMVEGNVLGAIAQGIGGALYENMVYDELGQLRTTTFMDYTLPTALEMPPCELAHQMTPSPFTLMGMKGAGESGIAAPLAAIASAVENAFPELRLELMETPFMPQRIWRALSEARARTPG
ncbi:MAG: xanthine dehydrogenase family protein molybdopterin-binding subunit [Candidatus Binatia bacterium]